MPSISDAQFGHIAEHVKEEGGGSFDWDTAKPVEGPGFMASYEGAEKPVEEATPEVLKGYHSDPENQEMAASHPDPYLGAWGANPTTLDVSRKIEDPKEARDFGNENNQEALFALRGTEVQPGVKAEDVANPWGANVLLRSHLEGDSDPRYQRHGDLFSAYEVENPDWDKVVGEHNGQPVTAGEVLRNLNRARVMTARGE